TTRRRRVGRGPRRRGRPLLLLPPSSSKSLLTLNQKTNVLLLEDNLIDAELIESERRRAGFEFEARRVDTEAEFVAALAQPVDLVLADYRLPQFDGLQALRHVQQRGLDVPFIIISSALGDELAAQCIKQGVTDYLVKDRLDRL